VSFLNPEWTPDRVKAFRSVTLASPDHREGIIQAFAALPADIRSWAGETIQRARMPLLSASVFVVPVLSPEACAEIVAKASLYPYSTNSQEDAPFQCEEAVLATVDALAERLIRNHLADALAPWLLMIYGRLPSAYASIQLARYSPTATAETSLHIDQDSNYSAVIALNEDFEGGGLEIVDGLLGSIVIPPLPVGYAILFDGRRVFHRGAKVTSGTRHILTIWANDDNDRW
jgi:hypothetical protein